MGTLNLSLVIALIYSASIFSAPANLVSALRQNYASQRYPIVNKDSSFLEIAACYRPNQFNKGRGLHNHHFIVWDGGRASSSALFVTSVSDSIVVQACADMGGVPGNNLTRDSWEQRDNPRNADPDIVATGSSIAISVRYNNRTYTPDTILTDVTGKGFLFRLAGNLALIPVWHSGCVVCLQSCPGGKIVNSRYTMRDLALDHSVFARKSNLPFHDGDTVVIRFTLEK
jgi:hypothetical protein